MIAILLSILLLIVAFWIGEAGNGLFQLWPYLFAILGFAFIYRLVHKNRKFKLLAGVLFLLLFVIVFYFGDKSFYKTYNHCINDSDSVRIALEKYKSKNKIYPESLNQLNISVPCKRLLRGTILNYSQTKSGYSIWFSDWLVTYEATESKPFMAFK